MLRQVMILLATMLSYAQMAAQGCTQCTAAQSGTGATGSCSIGSYSFQANYSATCAGTCAPITNCRFSFTISVVPTPVACIPPPVMTYDFKACPGAGSCLTAPTTTISLPFLQEVSEHQVQCGWKEYAWVTEYVGGIATVVAAVQLTCSACQ